MILYDAASSLPEHGYFTVLFRGDLRAFKSNPFHADTPFGRPVAIGIGDAMEREDAAVEEGSMLLEALELLVRDFGDYPASERPCHAFDVARAAIAKAKGTAGA